MGTTFRESFLSGTSECFASPADLDGCYDLLILASSWDQRCTCVTRAKSVKVTQALPIFFSVRDSLGLREVHDLEILKYCRCVAAETLPIEGNSTEVQTLWKVLHAQLARTVARHGRPVRLLLDISTCPRYLFGAIRGVGFTSGLVEKLTVFYAEAQYPTDQRATEIAFTGGRWRTIPIPGLLGKCRPDRKRFYLVSVGFEGWKTLRVVSRADPDRVSVLFPEPGFSDTYPEQALKNNRALFDRYGIQSQQTIKAHAGDAIGAWQALSTASLERSDSEDTFYLCCGTKPHSLALVLRALSLGYPTVLHNIPDQHMVHATRPNGRFWRCEINDLTALPTGS